MRHAHSRESANRHSNGLSRSTVEDTDDSHLLQEVSVRGFHGEQQEDIEHAHPYGFTARPKKPTGQGALRQAAEAFFNYLGGNRSHGVAAVTVDRRYRPNNLAYGDVVLHDDGNLQVYLSRGVLVIHAGTGLPIHLQTADGAHVLLNGSKVRAQVGDASVTVINGTVRLGAESANHAVLTVDGPSKRVFAVINETEQALALDPIATRTDPGQSAGGQQQR